LSSLDVFLFGCKADIHLIGDNE